MDSELRQKFQTWVAEHKAIANILATCLFFSLEMVIAKLFGDFDFKYNNDFPEQYTYYVALKIGLFALLSIINIYAVPLFIKWIRSNRPPPAVKLIVTGTLFGSIFCSVIGASVGLAFGLFLAVTLIRMARGSVPEGFWGPSSSS